MPEFERHLRMLKDPSDLYFERFELIEELLMQKKEMEVKQ